MRLANAAHVRTLVIFHHDPGHDDAFMDQVAADAADRPAGDDRRPGGAGAAAVSAAVSQTALASDDPRAQ